MRARWLLVAGVACGLGGACSPGVYHPGTGGTVGGSGGSGGAGGGSGGSGGSAQDGAVDAQPPDAQLCTGGQAAAIDPQTGHCYVFFSGVLIFDDAEASCRALGLGWHLATLTSAAEDLFVQALVGQTQTWFGFDNIADGVNFVWVTGEPVSYTNWAPGEPNAGANACARLRPDLNYLWADQPCASTYAYLCERDH